MAEEDFPIVIDGFTHHVCVVRDEDAGVLYRVLDIGRMIGLSRVRNSVKNMSKKYLYKRISKTVGENQSMILFTEPGLKTLLSKSRSARASDVASALGLDITNVFVHTIETSTMKNIMTAFKGEHMVTQYTVQCTDAYRIDLYFPKYRLAIECDESFHKYNKEEDVARQADIEKRLQCTFIRYAPQENDFDMFKVINLIYNHIREYHDLSDKVEKLSI